MEGKWLSDNVINAAQKLLKSRHSSIGGLQNTLLAKNMQFQIERGRFVQILNVSGSHWITIANVGCVQGEVAVFDSMGHTDLTQEVKQQIAALILTPTNKIILIYFNQFKDKLTIVEHLPLHLQHLFAFQQVLAIYYMIRIV